VAHAPQFLQIKGHVFQTTAPDNFGYPNRVLGLSDEIDGARWQVTCCVAQDFRRSGEMLTTIAFGLHLGLVEHAFKALKALLEFFACSGFALGFRLTLGVRLLLLADFVLGEIGRVAGIVFALRVVLGIGRAFRRFGSGGLLLLWRWTAL
jgi:hypothetical protein